LGDHVSIIRYDNAARIVGFEPVMPWDVEVYRVNNRNVYRCVLWDSSFGNSSDGIGQKVEWHDQEDVIHIPGLGFNGIRGLSRIRAFARNAISLAALMEEQTGRVHENAARPSGLATVPPGMNRSRRLRGSKRSSTTTTRAASMPAAWCSATRIPPTRRSRCRRRI
jgi:phage portal protein BeeE